MTDHIPFQADPPSSQKSSIVEKELEKIFMYRKQSLEEELEVLKSRKVVSDALELDSDSWAMMLIASNLGEKRTAMLTEEQSKKQQHQRQVSTESAPTTDHSKSSSDVVGWKGLLDDSRAELLRARDKIELEELQEQKVVLKSLQDPTRKFEDAALLFFGRKDSLNRSQKRSGNILISGDDEEDRLKHQTQTLLDVVFRVPSAKRKLHKKLMKQIREVESRKDELPSNRFSKSADHVLSISFDGDSSTSGGTSETSTSTTKEKWRQKIPRKLKEKYHSHTLPYPRRVKGESSHRLKKKEVTSHSKLMGRYPGLPHHLEADCDTLEELSEGEGSVASQATLRSESALMHDVPKPPLAPSPLHVTTATRDSPHNEIEMILDNNVLEQEEDCTELQITQERRFSDSYCLTTDTGNGDQQQHQYQEMVSTEFTTSESYDGSSVEGQMTDDAPSATSEFAKSLSDSTVSSTTSFLTQSSVDSSIKSSDGDHWIMEGSVSLSTSGKYDLKDHINGQSGIPELPRVNNGGMVSIEATQSWLDRYTNGRGVAPSDDSEQHLSSEDDFHYPPVSDISLPSDPGITPFVIGAGRDDINPLSSEFSDFDVAHDKWKGTLVHPKAWEDPVFREYSNTLDHEPTNDDVILFKMFVLSEAIEEKFGQNLDSIIGEAFVLAMKNQLSYANFCKLSHKLALQASGIKEGALLIAFLGRNLWEKLPELQEQIMEFTTQVLEECYTNQSLLDVGAPPDLSEIRADYDDWRGITSSSEIQNSILQENAPFIIDPSESLPIVSIPICISHQLPPFPPDPEAYKNYIMASNRPRIKQARSVEVLFKEDLDKTLQDEVDGAGVVDDSQDDRTPPKRTVSVSSFLEQDSMRRSSNCSSVFDSIPPTIREQDKRQTSPFNDSVIKANSKNDVLGLLESVEFGEQSDTLPRPIIFSASDALPPLSINGGRSPSRHSSIESTTSTSSSADSDTSSASPVPTRIPDERKISGIHRPTFDAILEEHEYVHVTTTDNQMTQQVNYEFINIIKPLPQPPTRSDSPIDDELEPPSVSESPSPSEEDQVPPERRRSSTEILTDIAAAVGLPLTIIAISAFKSLS